MNLWFIPWEYYICGAVLSSILLIIVLSGGDRL